MTYKTKRTIKKGAKAAFRGFGAALKGAVKLLCVLLMILVTTGVIFACIFVLYMKANLDTGDLDVTLDQLALNETSVIYYYDKKTDRWRESASIQSAEGNRYWVPYDEIPIDMEHALVAIEDKRFYTHDGVDWLRTGSAFIHMFAGMENTFGGSTITQQLRKNLTGEKEGTVRRKLTEIFAALELEKRYEKWQIIEYYLNVVNFGHGNSTGIGDAAKYYFDKEVSQLTLAEMCSIIGITNNPSMYNPYYHPEANKKRQETILYEMYDQGYIDYKTYEDAVAEELVFTRGNTTGYTGEIYSWFDEVVRKDVIQFLMEERGVSESMAKTLLATAGYKIYSTMDPEIQAAVDQIYQDLNEIPKVTGSSQQFQSAIVISDPYTGNVVALAGKVGTKDANLLYNLATDARRPPGSSFKPIAVYGPAMDLGLITPDTLFEDERDVVLVGKPGWLPRNDDNQTHGIVSIRTAIVRSFNIISAQVLDKLTPAVSYDFLTNKLRLNLDYQDEDYAPLCLGQLTYGITVREMANAFNIFPNGGLYYESRTFTAIYDSDGKLLYENKPDVEPVISESTAYWMTDILQNAVRSGTGTEAYMSTMPVAGKTGTSDSKWDRWFVGFTPYYTAAVWTGYEIPASIGAGNSNPAAVLWKKVMTLVHENLETKDFNTPANTYQQPVVGVQTVEYSVRCLSGNTIIYSQSLGTKVSGRTVTVTAPEIPGYELIGEREQSLTLSNNEKNNVVEFRYSPITQSEPEPEPDPEPDPTE